MADDRMKNDDLQRNMGGAGHDEGQKFGQQSPGRAGQGQESGQHAGGQGGTQQKTNYGSGQNARNMEDDEDLDTNAGRASGQGRGGQNR